MSHTEQERTKKHFLNVCTKAPCGHTPGLRVQATGHKVYLPVSIWEGIGCILSQLLPEALVLISLRMGPDEDPPGSLKLLLGTPHLFPTLFLQQEDRVPGFSLE